MKLVLVAILSILSVTVFAGTYTPTVANVQYVFPASIVSHKAQYSQANGIVHVAGSVELQADSDAMFSPPAIVSVSLPVSSALASEYDCNGVVGEAPHYNVGSIKADPSSGKVLLMFNPSVASSVYDPNSDILHLYYQFDCEVL